MIRLFSTTYLLLFSLFIWAQQRVEPSDLENSLLPAVAVAGEAPISFSLLDRMKHYKVPGVSIAVIQDGKLLWAKGYGVTNTETGQAVDENSLFQAGSISKPVAAMGALRLVQEGKIGLQTDINSYLTRWKVPENRFTKQKPVHMQGLLSHTAGMTVHGFPGYTQSDEFPSVETVLNGEGNTPAIVPDTLPGTFMRYSGGGYTVAQLAVEEVAEKPFADFLESAVLSPLEMSHSTYAQPLPQALHGNASAAFDSEGNMAEGLWNNYPELAAAGLWTTPTDLAKFCISIYESYSGLQEKVLSREMVKTMLQPVKEEYSYALGLGTYRKGDTLFFGHGGKNRGFTNNMKASATHGMGIIIMTNADKGGNLAEEIMRGADLLYQWGIPKQKLVKPYPLSQSEINAVKGSYRLDLPGVNDYLIEVKVGDSGLWIYDPQGTDNHLIPTSSLEFFDSDSGSSVSFEVDDKGKATGFIYAGEYQFRKLKL
ncbi:MAG: serine hydrolase domain-containing protein [Bacteroidota bacterium]